MYQRVNDQDRIYVGMGTCGLAAGADAVKSEIEKAMNEIGASVEICETGCVGACSTEVIVDFELKGQPRVSFGYVNAKNSAALTKSVLQDKKYEGATVIGQYEENGIKPLDGIPFIKDHAYFKKQRKSVLSRCGLIDPTSLDEYLKFEGYQGLSKAVKMSPDQVVDEMIKSGLRGRGGGGFPTGNKWKFARMAKGDQKRVVCNGDEGDPGAFMDRSVLEGDPFSLLEGMAIAAYAIGAQEGVIYVRAEYPLAIERLNHAISEAEKAGYLGDNILGSSFSLKIRIKKGAGAFVCGEETALLHSIEGKRGMPRPRPPFPANSGLFGYPTIINNVETLTNVPFILNKGGDWFASVGTDTSKGTKVFALTGKIANPGLVEVPMGISLREIIFDIGGGIPDGRKFKAVQIGGPSGGCIPEQHLDIKVDYETLKTLGAMMGSGGLVVMDDSTCMVDVAKFFLGFTTKESCGKCIPCREGTKRLSESLELFTQSYQATDDESDNLRRFRGIVNIEDLAHTVKEMSLCGLGQTAPNPILSTLRFFRDEYEAHVYDRKCPAGACTGLLTFTIDHEKCTGCQLCAKKCPSAAIEGERKQPHIIIEDKCIKCGQCKQVCAFNAVNAE